MIRNIKANLILDNYIIKISNHKFIFFKYRFIQWIEYGVSLVI